MNVKLDEKGNPIDFEALYKAEQDKSKSFEDRAIGAEKVIEKHKKKPNSKPDDDPKPQFWDKDMNRILDERDFYAKNPDMVEYKEKLSKLTQSGDFSLEEAKWVLEKRDPTIANRNNAKNIDFTTWKPWVQSKTMTSEEFWKLSEPEFKRANEMVKNGELKIT